jgi:hypothetical protein
MGVIEYLVDPRILIGALIGAAIMVPVVLNSPQWFSSKVAAIQKAGVDALKKAEENEAMKKALAYAKEQGLLKE